MFTCVALTAGPTVRHTPAVYLMSVRASSGDMSHVSDASDNPRPERHVDMDTGSLRADVVRCHGA